jgi:hypothetical protein
MEEIVLGVGNLALAWPWVGAGEFGLAEATLEEDGSHEQSQVGTLGGQKERHTAFDGASNLRVPFHGSTSSARVFGEDNLHPNRTVLSPSPTHLAL